MDILSIPEELLGEKVASKERIQSTVKRVAKEIYYSIDYVAEVPILLCLREGAVPFHRDLVSELTYLGFTFESAWLKTHHRYSGTEGSGEVKVFPYDGPDLDDRLVVIVEDIIDSGNTLFSVMEMALR